MLGWKMKQKWRLIDLLHQKASALPTTLFLGCRAGRAADAGTMSHTMDDAAQARKLLAVAPMMAWTDSHCRYLHRLFSANALLFTEMITADAVVRGPRERLLKRHPAERSVACQLGGNHSGLLAAAAEAAVAAGFAEINFNVGCPSPRVRQGCFGAALMAEPALVARCVKAMRTAGRPVTVKCRLGIDDRDSDAHLDNFIEAVADAGCQTVYVHARKALLSGLNPAQNRNIPPLQPERAYRLKERFPGLNVIVNGGITNLAEAAAHLRRSDGIMVGRAAWHGPRFLGELDAMMFGAPTVAEQDAASAYLDYAAEQLAAGAPLADLTKPMLGLFKGQPGARRYRQTLSSTLTTHSNDLGAVRAAVAAMAPTYGPSQKAA